MHPDTIHIVVDIETLGTQPGCRILSIGAVAASFDVNSPTQIFEAFLAPEDKRFTEDKATLEWWNRQDYLVKKANFFCGKTVPCEVSLSRFNNWIAAATYNRREKRFWSKGSNFDFPILEYAYWITNIPVPWKYWEILDLRTLLNVHKNIELPKRTNEPHMALNDALYEAQQLTTILRNIC